MTFDNGPEGSKAEDAFFALVAMDKGLTFDFVEGEIDIFAGPDSLAECYNFDLGTVANDNDMSKKWICRL